MDKFFKSIVCFKCFLYRITCRIRYSSRMFFELIHLYHFVGQLTCFTYITLNCFTFIHSFFHRLFTHTGQLCYWLILCGQHSECSTYLNYFVNLISVPYGEILYGGFSYRLFFYHFVCSFNFINFFVTLISTHNFIMFNW